MDSSHNIQKEAKEVKNIIKNSINIIQLSKLMGGAYIVKSHHSEMFFTSLLEYEFANIQLLLLFSVFILIIS